MITQTLVFQFENADQRQELLAKFSDMMMRDTFPRISAISMENELTRGDLMLEALDRYDDHYDLRDAIEALAKATDLHEWSWDEYD